MHRTDASTAVDPLYAFAFLQTFVDILTEYFGEVSTAKLRDNFDIVYQVRFLANPCIFGVKPSFSSSKKLSMRSDIP
jgi:hypothetical protein